MFDIFLLLLSSLRSCLSTRAALQAEILALRHQVLVLQRATCGRRHRLKAADRSVWGLVVSSMEELAAASEDHMARDRHCLESQGLPTVLDLEESSARWSSANKSRCSHSDTKDECCCSFLLCSHMNAGESCILP